MTYVVFWTFGIFGWWLPDGSYVQPPHRDDYRRAGLASQADALMPMQRTDVPEAEHGAAA